MDGAVSVGTLECKQKPYPGRKKGQLCMTKSRVQMTSNALLHLQHWFDFMALELYRFCEANIRVAKEARGLQWLERTNAILLLFCSSHSSRHFFFRQDIEQWPRLHSLFLHYFYHLKSLAVHCICMYVRNCVLGGK